MGNVCKLKRTFNIPSPAIPSGTGTAAALYLLLSTAGGGVRLHISVDTGEEEEHGALYPPHRGGGLCWGYRLARGAALGAAEGVGTLPSPRHAVIMGTVTLYTWCNTT